MFSWGRLHRHRHAAGPPWGVPRGVRGVPNAGPRAGVLQPKGRTPIQAPWAQNAKPAQATAPSSTVATVGPARPGA